MQVVAPLRDVRDVLLSIQVCLVRESMILKLGARAQKY